MSIPKSALRDLNLYGATRRDRCRRLSCQARTDARQCAARPLHRVERYGYAAAPCLEMKVEQKSKPVVEMGTSSPFLLPVASQSDREPTSSHTANKTAASDRGVDDRNMIG